MIFSNLDFEQNIFHDIANNMEFEDITKGRKAITLVNSNVNIPIVRSTTKYKNSAKLMTPEVFHVLNLIQNKFGFLNLKFNNCLAEIYDTRYRTMKYHTDQTLDLEKDSYICIFSCYENTKSNRIFQYYNKLSCFEKNSLMTHNSIILFSVYENYRHTHKIILDTIANSNDRWLGLTFRFSKTFIKFINEIPYFCHNNMELKLATPDEEKKLYEMKSIENIGIIFEYPEIFCTVSTGDLLFI
jgi:hypothetical protein